MSDLVERLREKAHIYDANGATLVADDLREAAARISELEAELAKQDARSREFMRTRRWNITEDTSGRLSVCRGEHAKGHDCEPEYYVREERLAELEAELAEARAQLTMRTTAEGSIRVTVRSPSEPMSSRNPSGDAE